MWIGDFQCPCQCRDGTDSVDAHQSLEALLQDGIAKQSLDQLFLRRLEHLHRTATHTKEILDRFRYFPQALHQVGEVLLPMQPLSSNGAPLSISRPAILFCIRTDCRTTRFR